LRAAQPLRPRAILGEGFGVNPAAEKEHFLLVADETGLPAMAGVLKSLPATTARGSGRPPAGPLPGSPKNDIMSCGYGKAR
jgi:hypothetical protein